MNPKISIVGQFKNLSKKKIKEKITNYLERVGIDNFEVGIYSIDKEKMTRLNRDYRNKDQSTDVLSFPIDEPLKNKKSKKKETEILGDIFISIKDIKRKNPDKEVEIAIWKTIKHGLVHLIGIGHKNKKEEKKFNHYFKK
jgi:probable rRNA maturation factor